MLIHTNLLLYYTQPFILRWSLAIKRTIAMAYTPNNRTTIDQEVFKWVKQQKQKDKVVTVNLIRQKAFELGQELDPNFKASLNWYNNWKKRYNYCESPEAEALKHKKRHYTAAFKLHAVQRAAEMESASQAALELDVSRRCLQRWTEEVELISSVAEHSSNAVYRYVCSFHMWQSWVFSWLNSISSPTTTL